VVQDGATVGGFAAAKLSEAVTIGAATLLAQAAHGGGITVGCLEQLVTLSGATTTSTAQISEWRDCARGVEPRGPRDHRRDLL